VFKKIKRCRRGVFWNVAVGRGGGRDELPKSFRASTDSPTKKTARATTTPGPAARLVSPIDFSELWGFCGKPAARGA
jgi:hypothetical protein